MGCECICEGSKKAPLVVVSIYSFVIVILSFVQVFSYSNYGYLEIPNELYKKNENLAKYKTFINLLANLIIFFYCGSRIIVKKCKSGIFFSLLILLGFWLGSLVLTAQSISRYDEEAYCYIQKYEWVFKIDFSILAFNCANFFPIFIYFFRSCKDEQDGYTCDVEFMYLFILIFEILEWICNLKCNCNCCEECAKYLESKVFNKLKLKRDEMNNLNQGLDNQLKQLEEDIKKLKNENQASKNEKEILTKKNQDLISKKAQLIVEKEKLDKQIIDLNDNNSKLEREKQKMNLEKDELERQKNYLDDKKTNLREKQKDLFFTSMIYINKNDNIKIYEKFSEIPKITIIIKFKPENEESLHLEDKTLESHENELLCDIIGSVFKEAPYSNYAKKITIIEFNGHNVKLFKSIKDNSIKDGDIITIQYT